MREARTKAELMIEVWEILDCESVGAAEIISIEDAVRERFGPSAVDSPMVIARLLADEGADLRHSELMALWIERNSERPYDASFRNILQLSGLRQALSTIRNLDNLRRKFKADGDKEGLRLLRETAIRGRKELTQFSSVRNAESAGPIALEVSQWLSVWLQTPDLFSDWVELRRRSGEFVEQFGQEEAGDE